MAGSGSRCKPNRFGRLWCLSLVLFTLDSARGSSNNQAAKDSPMFKNHRMGDIVATSSPAELSNDVSTLTTTLSPTTSTSTTMASSFASQPDIIINSIEDELQIDKSPNARQAGAQLAGNRHRYEQPSQVVSGAIQSGEPIELHQVQQLESQPAKIEARNQADSLEQQQESVIVDHRPSGGQSLMDGPAANSAEQPTSSQPPPVSFTSTPPSSTSVSPHVPSVANVQTSAQSQPTGASQMAPQWVAPASVPTNQQQVYLASQPQASSNNNNNNNQQQQFGSMVSASNQFVSVQHPTSINSIISEQQQQQQQSTNNIQSQTPAVMANANGQPSLILVNQPQTGAGMVPQQIIGVGQNGRRVSISNWLRGIGSMLANIFNRRDHGASLQPAMMASSTNGIAVLGPASQSATASPGGGSGNWIQLGPNAPHWLTQAQSAIQQFQQQHHQLGAATGRFAAFIQAPQQQQAMQQQVVSLAPTNQQQQAVLNGQQQQLNGDLQMSGSAPSIATAPSGVALASGHPYASGTIVFTQLGGGPALAPPQTTQAQTLQQQQPISKQQQQQLQTHSAQQVNQNQIQSQMRAASLSSSSSPPPQQQQQPQSMQSGDIQTNRIHQMTSASVSSNQVTRHGRSSSALPVSLLKTAQTSAPNSGGNLPLAHYSRYTTSD